MNLINLTPHEVRFVNDEGNDILLVLPSGQLARCREERELAEKVEVSGILLPVNETFFGDLTGLPEPSEGTTYIVSRAVIEAAPHRDDLVIPDQTVRDTEGRVVGCKALARPRR